MSPLLVSLLHELDVRRTRLFTISRWGRFVHRLLFAHYRLVWRHQIADPLGSPGGRTRTVQFPLVVHSYRTLSLLRRVLLGIITPSNLSALSSALNHINWQSTRLLDSNLPDFVATRIGAYLGLESSSLALWAGYEGDRSLELDHFS